MDEHDIIRKLGRFIDKIYHDVSEAFEPGTTMDWQCGRCGYVQTYPAMPGTCIICGFIVFTTVD